MIDPEMADMLTTLFGEGAVTVWEELEDLIDTLPPEQSVVITRFLEMFGTGIQMNAKSARIRQQAAFTETQTQVAALGAKGFNVYLEAFTAALVADFKEGGISPHITRAAIQAAKKVASEALAKYLGQAQ